MKAFKSRDTWREWVWWLFCALILVACVTYPLRFLLNPEIWSKLSWWEEIFFFVLTVFGTAAFVVKPFYQNTIDDQ